MVFLTRMLREAVRPEYITKLNHIEKPVQMSKYRRVQQWMVFGRSWWLMDMKHQDPYDAAIIICKHLWGGHKAIYDPHQDTGDFVVCYNCKEVALPDDEWKWRMFYHHTGYSRHRRAKFIKNKWWTPAWELHARDPTYIVERFVWRFHLHAYPKTTGLLRHEKHARLMLYPDDNIPDHVMCNITGQIRQIQPVLRSLDSFTQEELAKFPKVTDFPDDFSVSRMPEGEIPTEEVKPSPRLPSSKDRYL